MNIWIFKIFVVQSLSHVQLFATPWTVACQASLSFIISQSLLKLMSIDLVMPSNYLILCCPLFLLPSILLSIIVFSYQVAKVLDLQLQHQSFQWIFRVDFLLDWLSWSPCCPRDFQESSPAPHFKSISSLALSFLYGPILTFVPDYWKNQSFDNMDLCQQSLSFFNMLSEFVTAFLLRSKHLLILCLQPLSAMILEPKKINSVTVSVSSPIYLPWSDANRCHDLRFLDVEF